MKVSLLNNFLFWNLGNVRSKRQIVFHSCLLRRTQCSLQLNVVAVKTDVETVDKVIIMNY